MCPSTYWASPASCAHVIFNSEQYGGKKLVCTHISGKGGSKSIGVLGTVVVAGFSLWSDVALVLAICPCSRVECLAGIQAVAGGAQQGQWQEQQLPRLSLKAGVAAVSGSFGLKSWSFSTSSDSVNHSVAF